ncbi:MAG TPA: YCF48-related protein [Acidimicrobiia bacterium]|nr:YCF48-related protein [Acidimicrobiia bacterium]
MDEFDDLPIIELDSEDGPVPERVPNRVPRRRAVLVGVAIALLAGAIVAVVAGHAHHARARSSATIVLPPPASATTQPVDRVDPEAEFVSEMGVVAPRGAWAINTLGVALTSDGLKWRNITPPGFGNPVQSTSALAVLDARHAWIATNVPEPTIWRTSDGGHVWQPTHVSLCSGSCGPVVGLDFLDARNGWAAVVGENGGGALAVTDDGGTTWRGLGATPFLGPIHFADTQHGWATSRIQPGSIFRTDDGGSTWSSVARADPGATPIGSPVFVGAHTVVAASVTSDQRVLVEQSTDGGRAWATVHAPDAGPHDPYAGVTATSASEWMLSDGARLYLTRDAGAHWTTLRPTHTRLVSVAFASRTDGWVQADVPDCGRPIGGCIDQYLYGTVDGGRTWTLRSPTAGITANRLP